MLVFLRAIVYISGMRYRDRQCFEKRFEEIITQEILDLLVKLHKNDCMQTLENECNLLLQNQVQVTSNIIKKSTGKLTL